jgi:hypothetical protein
MKDWTKAVIFGVQWAADRLDRVTLPVLFVLAVFSARSLQVIVIVAFTIWIAAKVLKRVMTG